jgi:copper chaperone CopZ
MVTTLLIDGMRSVHCARAVFTSLTQVPGIDGADVVMGRATLSHLAPLDETALRDAVQSVGYEVGAITTDRRTLPLHLGPNADGGGSA